MPDWLESIERQIAVGDFLSARAQLDANRARRPVRRTDDPAGQLSERFRAAALIAEIDAYFGDNRAARRALMPIARRASVLALRAVPARHKLQLAELHYARRDFAAAIRVAERVLAHPDTRADGWGTGEVLYYLARYTGRLNRLDQAAALCARALESFSSAARVNPAEKEALRWRIGLVLLTDGNSRWRAGHLTEARGALHAALSLLTDGKDVIGVGNAHQSLGCILRSQGEHEAALCAFGKALSEYQRGNHRLNEARVLTNIARTHLCTRDFSSADETLTRAMSLCAAVTRPDPMWQRQKGEVFVWHSLLLQHAPPLRFREAARSARRALVLATRPSVKSRGTAFEARIALGYSLLRQGADERALPEFRDALAVAEELKVKKLLVNGHLSLAECYCGPRVRDIALAQQHQAHAQRLIDGAHGGRDQNEGLPGSGVEHPGFSAFLVAKAERTLQLIRSAGDNFLLSPKDLGTSGLQLRQAVANLKDWAIRVSGDRYGSVERAAQALGISRQHWYTIQRRSARPSPRSGRGGRSHPRG
jgi:tetratricopeptide (TPR) repeat protein